MPRYDFQPLINAGISLDDAQALRRISMTLHRWHEMECGDDNGYSSFCIARGRKVNGAGFEHDDKGRSFLEIHPHSGGTTRYQLIPDRERGARKRLAAIMARYPALGFYVQGDPRGAALYVLRVGDVSAGEDPSAYYSRGIAVYR